MKLATLLLFSALFTASACNSNKSSKEGENTSPDFAKKENAETEKIKEAAEGMDKQKEELGKLTPISGDELKAMLPATLLDAKQENAEVDNNSGANMATADYKINDSTAITVTIIDCAGPAGAGIYNMQYLGMVNALQETEEEYTKATTVNGNNGFEHCDKTNNDCVIAWFAAKRYLITVEGEGAAVIKKAASTVQIK
jgi:hypothetical protein